MKESSHLRAASDDDGCHRRGILFCDDTLLKYERLLYYDMILKKKFLGDNTPKNV